MWKHLISFISNLYDKSNQASMDGIQMGEQLKKIIPYLYSELLEHVKNITLWYFIVICILKFFKDIFLFLKIKNYF